MKTINLVNPEQSDVKFHISNFPDGQVGVKLDHVYEWESYRIVSRFSSYQNMMVILSTNQVLRDSGVKYVELFCPYFLSARSDRKFDYYESFDLKLTAQIINLAKFDKVFVLDPHSDVLPALVENCSIISIDHFIHQIPPFFWDDKLLISPDAGAYKRIFKIGEMLNLPIITGNKVRDPEGNITLEIYGEVNRKKCVIVDDICDGGRTFELLGGKLKDLGVETVDLVVTHGIFSRGWKLKNIDEIWTTNSYRDFPERPIPHYFNVINVFK